MLVTKEIVELPRGLQARNTTKFVAKACSFNSDVFLVKNSEAANGKELMKVMNLKVNNRDEVTLLVNGIDEQIAIHALRNFLLDN